MDELLDMVWVEMRKALRSRMPLGTAVGSLFLPFGIAFLIFVSKNPGVSQKLGLVSAKADLMAFAAADWQAYLGVYGQMVGIAGFILSVLIISWTFGREFTEGTLKDLLAVPVSRLSILLAKFILVAVWFAVLTLFIFAIGLAVGVLLKLPGGSDLIFLHGVVLVLVTGCLIIPVTMPFAFFASAGRGYLLPIGAAILTMIMANLVIVIGWGEYFPWAVPALYAQAKSPLGPASYWIVFFTGLAGVLATFLWWRYTDQSR